ncbi:MAG: hypothetical protein ACOX4G_09460 [Limnochordia bacterium]
MRKPTILRNEATQAGRDIWAAVDKGAERAPAWIKARMEVVLAEQLGERMSDETTKSRTMPNA